MKLKFKEAYQGWAAVELGRLRHERVEPGVHEVVPKFGEYLLAKFPHLVEEVKPEVEEVKPEVEKKPKRGAKKEV